MTENNDSTKAGPIVKVIYYGTEQWEEVKVTITDAITDHRKYYINRIVAAGVESVAGGYSDRSKVNHLLCVEIDYFLIWSGTYLGIPGLPLMVLFPLTSSSA